MDQFDDIRPYHDHEVGTVLRRLLDNKEFTGALATFTHPLISRFFGPLLRFVIRKYLAGKFEGIHNVKDFQHLVEPYLIKMIERTITKVTWSGLDQLEQEKAFLFLSNHRDIVLDPAFVNYGLHQDGRETARVAIGDNLLGKPYVSDLMRLNKSFIVKRSLTRRKEKMEALKTLSRYISHSVETGHSVWLAHREGRAKDGNDFTDSAIIKMLSFSHRSEGIRKMLEVLNIVPVAISYELDPCDRLKANELYQRETLGEYVKAEEEDMKSIVSGIQGQKGRVHIAFGRPVSPETPDISACTEEIDRQIHQLYKLFPVNYAACEKLHLLGHEEYNLSDQQKSLVSDEDRESGKRVLENRCSGCKKEVQIQLLKLYANPVRNQLLI